MSKSEKEKLIITVEQAPILLELGIDELYQDYRKVEEKYKFHKTEQGRFDVKRTMVKESIKIAMTQANPDVDTVVYTDPKGAQWQSTIVKPEPKKELDVDKLKTNIMKHAKVAAPIVDKILKDSINEKPVKSYVLVTLPEDKK